MRVGQVGWPGCWAVLGSVLLLASACHEVPSPQEYAAELERLQFDPPEEGERRLARLLAVKQAHPSFDLTPAYRALLLAYRDGPHSPLESRVPTFIALPSYKPGHCVDVSVASSQVGDAGWKRIRQLGRGAGSFEAAAEISFAFEDLEGWRADRALRTPRSRFFGPPPPRYKLRGAQLLMYEGRGDAAAAEAIGLGRDDNRVVGCAGELLRATIAEDTDNWDLARSLYQEIVDGADERAWCARVAQSRLDALGPVGPVYRRRTTATIQAPSDVTVRAAFSTWLTRPTWMRSVWQPGPHHSRVPAWGMTHFVVADVKGGTASADLPPGDWRLELWVDGPDEYSVEGLCDAVVEPGQHIGSVLVTKGRSVGPFDPTEPMTYACFHARAQGRWNDESCR